eukprot:superscaffoldBa00000378_g4233
MEMEKGHMSIRRGVSWSPGGLRKPLQATQEVHTPGTECNASWEKTGFNNEQMSRKTNLTRSASLSEKELKEARVRSQIIAAQLTIPSNSSSRGVQLFNRRKQRVNAFTLESCGEGSTEDRAENVKTDPLSNKLTWAERSSEERDRDLNYKNSTTKPLLAPPGRVHTVGDIMDEPGKHFHKEDDIEDSVIQERHFLPVKEVEEQDEEERDEIHQELEGKIKDEIAPGSNNTDPVLMRLAEGEAEINGGHTGPVPPGKFLNGCHSTSGPERVSVSTSKQATGIVNRTARPFFSPPTVQSPETVSPVNDIPPPPSYATPPLPTFTAPQPVAFSPPNPPPSYPTPPLPAFTNQPQQTYYSNPPPMSPVMSPSSPPPSQFPVSSGSQYVASNSPMPHYGPPTAPKPSTFVPQPTGERKPTKTGILEESAAKRSNRKSMFTFKEKPVVAPNPELLSLVQGLDERKKHGHKSVPEPASEEELLALGAEASNFLAKEEDRAEEAKAPEWTSCLKSSRTRPRAEHRPEQTLNNASGKGAELFAKRQSRMEKYVVEHQNTEQIRSPSPTMSLPPSWVYPSNMPGRVKAIARNSDVSAQVSQNLKAQQTVKPKPRPNAPAPEPVPEQPPLENGCSKMEMDLSRHRPYQLNSSLFILNPVKDPISTLPRGAPQAKNLMSPQSLSRHNSLPNNPPSHFGTRCMSPQLPLSPTRGAEYPSNSASVHPRISSPMSAFSPGRVSSPRSGVQSPRPTFSAKKAGIEPQASPNVYFSFSCMGFKMPVPSCKPACPIFHCLPHSHIQIRSNIYSRLPTLGFKMSVPNGEPEYPVCHHVLSFYFQTFPNFYKYLSSFSSLGFKMPIAKATSPAHLPWSSRSQSPAPLQTSLSFNTAKPLYTPSASSPVPTPKDSRCMSPVVNNLDSKANHRILAKNIINAAKRKNSPSPGALSSHSLPISPLGNSHHGYDCHKPPISPYQSRPLGAQSPTFTSPPPTPTQRICSPVRLYNTRSLTDSDASVESEDSGLRSPGLHSYNTCPRGWGGSLRVKRSTVSTDL